MPPCHWVLIGWQFTLAPTQPCLSFFLLFSIFWPFLGDFLIGWSTQPCYYSAIDVLLFGNCCQMASCLASHMKYENLVLVRTTLKVKLAVCTEYSFNNKAMRPPLARLDQWDNMPITLKPSLIGLLRSHLDLKWTYLSIHMYFVLLPFTRLKKGCMGQGCTEGESMTLYDAASRPPKLIGCILQVHGTRDYLSTHRFLS